MMQGLGAWMPVLVTVAALAAAGAIPAAAQTRSDTAQAGSQQSGAKPTLRLCEDPNNLPFSSRAADGYEDRIGALIAQKLGATVEHVWRPQRRGFVRNTLGAHKCDLMVTVPSHYDPVETTKPYYHTTYVFVYRSDRGYHITSLNDPILHRVKIGIHITGDDYDNPPAAAALAARHIVDNVKGYMIYGDQSKANPPSNLIDAVANGDVDVAIVWGPFAGYFAPRESVPLTIVPVSPHVDSLSGQPFVYSMSMGVPKGDTAAVTLLNRLIDREQPAIRAILQAYGIPLVEGGKTSLTTAEQENK
ncbi:MAG TPA: quinoprotein dehydrogenase-associated putative ABC transporter substrate-binding protein [Gemmatimonadaceae bacterium]|nr:quinoprotein dehydrogenase-associated putative ABC transporter substrate-binding protein [Gemmatimonadaceae bacterium]